jgi:hypothetical protein
MRLRSRQPFMRRTDLEEPRAGPSGGVGLVLVVSAAPRMPPTRARKWPVSRPASGAKTAVVAADLDQDGRVDIVSGSVDPGAITISYGEGHGRFSAPQQLPAEGMFALWRSPMSTRTGLRTSSTAFSASRRASESGRTGRPALDAGQGRLRSTIRRSQGGGPERRRAHGHRGGQCVVGHPGRVQVVGHGRGGWCRDRARRRPAFTWTWRWRI